MCSVDFDWHATKYTMQLYGWQLTYRNILTPPCELTLTDHIKRFYKVMWLSVPRPMYDMQDLPRSFQHLACQ